MRILVFKLNICSNFKKNGIGFCYNFFKGVLMGQIINRKNISDFIKKLHEAGKTVAATNGCFDILHAGHVKYLQKTKSFADYSLVLLNSDKSVKSIKGESRPINSESDRAYILSALSCVDFIVLFDEDSPAQLLDEIKPDVYTKGADYTMDTLPERDIMIKNGTRVEFIELVQGKSTTGLIEKISNKE